jgi:hypothetical protein
MKPFNLEAALRGEPLITRDGRKVLEIHFFKETDKENQCIVYHAEDSPLRAAYIKGNCIYSGEEDDGDLFMKVQKKKLYILISNTCFDAGFGIHALHTTSNAYVDKAVAQEQLNHCSDSQLVEIEIEV